MLRTLFAALLPIALGGAIAAHAQPYPSKPVKVVVPLAPGGGTDIFARVMATELSRQTGQQFMVDNKPGAGNVIGIRNVVGAPPDGYRLLFSSNTVTIDQSVKKNPEFDVLRDLTPIANVVNGVYALVVSTSIPATTLGEFVEWVKAHPGKVNYGSPGTATTGHLVSEEFARVTGTRMFHVPYSGVAPATNALMAGDIQVLWNDVVLSQPAVAAGKARILAVASRARSPIVPNVPTVAESGYPDFEIAFKFGFYAPAKTPPAIVDKLNKEILTALAAPSVRAVAAERGWQIDGTTPQAFATMLTAEIDFWGTIVKQANIEKQ